MLPVLVILAIGFHLLSGRFLSVNNLSIVMQQASINTVLAAGMTFVILTGGIDLSVGSILAASAMVAVHRLAGPGSRACSVFRRRSLVGLGLRGRQRRCIIACLKLPPFIVTLGSLTACAASPA